jgi:hypothetical protein
MVEFLDQHRDQLACADRSSRGYCGLPLQQTALHPNVRIALAEPRDQVDSRAGAARSADSEQPGVKRKVLNTAARANALSVSAPALYELAQQATALGRRISASA